MPHSTPSSPTTPASLASEPPSARTSSHPHTSHSSTAASPSSSSSFALTTPPPATASHSSAYRQSPSLSPSVSSTSAGASAAAAAAGGGGTAPHTPPPVMRFQKNLALQKHQATMEDRRGHTVWMQKYRAVYEQVSREYASAKHWHDPFVLSLRRLNAPAHVSAAAAPPSIPTDPTQTFHHNRLRATSLLHLHQQHLDPFSAGTGTAGGGPDGHVVMTRTRSSGPSTSASGGSGGSGSNSGGHASALGRLDGRRAQQQKSSQPAGPARASTVRGLSALLRGELPGTAVARSQ
ncbi:hypothetical protein HDU89_003425 [Geranomyces variabilis]|nr:hypothetical protein HDU89_003425 [Geranomyces variabilis]